MRAMVDLGPGADRDALAVELAELVRRNVTDSDARAAFEELRGSVALIATDANTTLTLRFDLGRLVVHEGLVGVPEISVRGALEDLRDLGRLRLPGRSLDATGAGAGRERGGVLRGLARALATRRLEIYGLWSHPRLVLRLLRVLVRRPD
ncbi:MAG: hypothetical protein IT376_03220 [Polyangiaceae bacterium]|nr:hypothetical protein [Polyangiaceae bacterium]